MVKETKRVAKRVQKSKVVRGLEKRAVRAGADVLRGAATAATDGLADSALESTQCAHPPTTITGRLRGRVAHTAVTQLTTIPHCGRHTCTDRW
eukprot:COSAG06_NODE_364_length_16784_cov_21.917231_11_plen_93_part_00